MISPSKIYVIFTSLFLLSRLPPKPFLQIIQIALSLPPPHRAPHVIPQGTGAAAHDAHSAHRLLALPAHHGIQVGSSGEHAHGLARAFDLLSRAGPGDEEGDAQDVAAAREREDGDHKGPDPFQVFGRLDHPDEADAARGDGAVREAVDQRGDEGQDVGDPHAAGDQEERAVAGERRGGGVGAFNQGIDGGEGGRGDGFGVQF